MNLRNKLEERGEALLRFEELTNIAAKRSLTVQENKEIDEVERKIHELDAEIAPLQKNEDRKKKLVAAKFSSESHMNKSFGEMDDDEDEMNQDHIEKQSFDFQIKKSTPFDRARPVSDFVLRNFDVDDKMKKANVYAVIAGLCGRKYQPGSPNDYALDQIQKSSMSASALLNPYLSAQLLEGALSKSRLAEAGMKTFAMLSGEHKFARVATYPTLEWKGELDSTTERTITFDNVTFSAKTLRGYISVGAETMKDALNIETALRSVFSKALGNGIDTAGLFGAGGADEPLGVANYVGVPTVSWNSTLDSYDPFIAAQKAVYEEDGGDLTASIMAPDAWSQLARLKGTNELNPVNPPFWMKDHKFLQTTKVPTNTGSGNQSQIIMGGFNNLNLGVRLQAEVILTPVIAETYSYNMLAVFRGDFQPNRVEEFAVIENVDPAPALT